MINLGIFADFPVAATGMAVVCSNLAREIASLYPDIRVIYFGRFGIEDKRMREKLSPFEEEHGFSDEPALWEGYYHVPTVGGVWQKELVEDIIKYYGIQVAFSEDDWFSAEGLVKATTKCNVPLHFLTPIDSLPIPKQAFRIFKKCKKVYVPNRAYKLIKNGYYLPHGVNFNVFFPKKTNRFKQFTFLWIGRDEERKALGRAIIAFKNIYKEGDMQLIIRSNWNSMTKSGKGGRATRKYLIQHPELPIRRDMMKNCPRQWLNTIYNSCDVLICTAKAGACEMGNLEAMACGLPVLCTDTPFMNEYIKHGKSGFLIPLENYCGDTQGLGRIWGNISIEKLSEKMLWCVQNPKKVRMMGNWASKWVTKKYRWDEQAKRLISTMRII